MKTVRSIVIGTDEIYDDAQYVSVNNKNYLVSDFSAVSFPLEIFLKSCSLIHKLNSIRDDSEVMKAFTSQLLQRLPEAKLIDRFYRVGLEAFNENPKYILSRSGLSLIIEYKGLSIVIFNKALKSDKIISLYNETSMVLGVLGKYIGVAENIKLNWEGFDDEKFELLCYDIIYHNPIYDKRTIRKMGKSRSRDGGRDIVVHTKARLGNPSKKFIFQCKFISQNSSLTAKKVENISDTIAQYKADGYGVFTPAVIDSTLYDRIDAIGERFQVDSDNWSGLEIERFVARNPVIKNRYFI